MLITPNQIDFAEKDVSRPADKAILSLAALAVAQITGLASAQAAGPAVASFCTLKSMDPSAQVEGFEVDKRLVIASVSKAVTSWFAVAEKGSGYRFQTRFYWTPTGTDTYNVHIQGSRDPYFEKASLHLAISELHKRGVHKVDKLTFDRNFKFRWDISDGKTYKRWFSDLDMPTPSEVLGQLRSRKLTSGWDSSLSHNGRRIDLVSNPSFTVKAFEPKDDFQPSSDTKVAALKSNELTFLLKEMNRNSNNWAANQIFEHMGGAARFQSKVKSELGLGESQIRFINGSGDRESYAVNPGVYNEASCASVLKILNDLRSRLLNEGKDLENVMAVAGGDNDSTTGRIYTTPVTNKSLIAKTGTTDPNVTLAGIVRTNGGDILFLYNMKSNGNKGTERAARNSIRDRVVKLIQENHGGNPLSYSKITFLSIDDQSAFEEGQALPVLP